MDLNNTLLSLIGSDGDDSGASIIPKTFNANGTYYASDEGVAGYNPVTVAVPKDGFAKTLSVNSNNTYYISDDPDYPDCYGWNIVYINVPQGPSTIKIKSGADINDVIAISCGHDITSKPVGSTTTTKLNVACPDTDNGYVVTFNGNQKPDGGSYGTDQIIVDCGASGVDDDGKTYYYHADTKLNGYTIDPLTGDVVVSFYGWDGTYNADQTPHFDNFICTLSDASTATWLTDFGSGETYIIQL